MTFYSCVGDLKGNHGDPMEVGKAVFNFFVFQHEQAVSEEIAARSRLNSAEAANDAAQREFERECGGLGSHFTVPYNASALHAMKTEAERRAKDRVEAKAMLNFMRDRLLEGFIKHTDAKV